jgi:hypothetical protein
MECIGLRACTISVVSPMAKSGDDLRQVDLSDGALKIALTAMLDVDLCVGCPCRDGPSFPAYHGNFLVFICEGWRR